MVVASLNVCLAEKIIVYTLALARVAHCIDGVQSLLRILLAGKTRGKSQLYGNKGIHVVWCIKNGLIARGRM